MTHVTCRLTAKNRDQLRKPTLCNRVWATFLPCIYSCRLLAYTCIMGPLIQHRASRRDVWLRDLCSGGRSTCYRLRVVGEAVAPIRAGLSSPVASIPPARCGRCPLAPEWACCTHMMCRLLLQANSWVTTTAASASSRYESRLHDSRSRRRTAGNRKSYTGWPTSATNLRPKPGTRFTKYLTTILR